MPTSLFKRRKRYVLAAVSMLGMLDPSIAATSSPDFKDSNLYRPRWSLPPIGMVSKLEPDDVSSEQQPQNSDSPAVLLQPHPEKIKLEAKNPDNKAIRPSFGVRLNLESPTIEPASPTTSSPTPEINKPLSLTSRAIPEAATEAAAQQLNAPPATPASPKIIEAGVSVWDAPTVSKIVDTLVDNHLAHSQEAKKLDDAVKHFSTPTQKVISTTKDSLNRSLGMQGTDPSARGAKIALEENTKSRDRTTAEYQRQRYVDKIHTQVISSLSEIAMGLGIADKTQRSQILNNGIKSLASVVGEDEARRSVSGLKTWLGRTKIPPGTFERPVWGTMERENKLETILTAALNKDEVIAETRKRLNKYAHPTKISSVSSKVVQTSFNAAAFLSPGFALPIGAEVALDAYIAATGGSEESKLEKEMIYDKRLQSRLKILNQEATLALDNYRFSMVTKNSTLLLFSEAVISDMTTDQVTKAVLSGQIVSNQSPQIAENLPGLSESKQPKQKSGILHTVKSSVFRAF